MLLSFDDAATPLRKGAGSAVALIPSSRSSFSTSELYSALIVDSPASAERGFFATSFDGNNCRKNLFVVSPDHSQGLELLNDDGGHHQPSFLSLDTSEDSIQPTGVHEDAKDVASLILKAEKKLSVVRLSLERALSTAESIRMLSSANGDQKETTPTQFDAGEPPIPRPRRGLPTPHCIEEERNLRLVADLVLTPGKTLILSPP